MAENLGTDCAKVCKILGERVNKTGTKLLIYHGRVFMVDMKNFTLTKPDDELYAIIKPVKQYSSEHKILAVWGIDCLNRFLPVFEAKYPNESKVLYTAVGTLQKWINGEIKMWDARKYTYTVLSLAREIEKNDKAYSQIVRAASHCLATCHVPTHSEGVAMYTVSFLKLNYKNNENVFSLMEEERKWQIDHLQLLTKGVNK